MNDKKRAKWVEFSDELREMWQSSGKSKRRWVSENRELIDEVVGCNILVNQQR